MSNPRSSFDLQGEWAALLHAAEAQFDDDGVEINPDPELDAAFALLGEDVEAKIAGTGHVLRRFKADAEAIKDEEARLALRRKVLLSAHARLELRLRELMRSTGKNAKTPTITVTLGKVVQRASVTDASKIPRVYMRYPVPAPSPIMRDIETALKAGDEVAGAELVDGKRTLRIS